MKFKHPKFKYLGSAVAVTAITGLAAFGLVAPASAETTVTATSDTASVLEDGSVTINVLANDLPATGLTLQGVTTPNKGTATVVAGQVVYTPKADFHGTDTFAYTVTDGTSTVGGAVSVTVAPVNDAPVATADSATTTVGTVRTIKVLGNDKDVDGDSLVVVLQSQPAHGTAALDVSTQKVTYTPVAGYVGADSFTYYASDGTANSATVTVSITVKAEADLNARDAKVVAICSANTADQRITGLCGVYLNLEMPPWALAQLGHVIIKLDAAKPAPQADAVLTVCAAEDDDHIQWLCDLYEAGNMPPGLKAIVGQRIVLLSQDDGGHHSSSADDDKKDHKQWKPAFGISGWGHGDKSDKDKGDKSNSDSQTIANDSQKDHESSLGTRSGDCDELHADRDKDGVSNAQSVSFGDDHDGRKSGRNGGHGWGHKR